MKIRTCVKLKSFKLQKILDDSKDNKTKNKNNSLYQKITTNNVCSKTKIYNYQKKNVFEPSFTKIHDNYLNNKSYSNKNRNRNRNRMYINNENYNKNNLFLLNKKNKIDSYKSFDNNISTKCFPVPQTLNYYGQNNIKMKAAKAVMKMNNLLLKNNINNLSLPKNQISKNSNYDKLNTFSPINDKKIFNMKRTNCYLKDKNYKNLFLIKSNSNSKGKKLSLLERERRKKRHKYNKILMEKFSELEECEKKFDIVIENTLQKLNNDELYLYQK